MNRREPTPVWREVMVCRVYADSAHNWREVRVTTWQQARRLGAELLGVSEEDVIVRYVKTICMAVPVHHDRE